MPWACTLCIRRMAGVTRPHKVENFKGQYMIFTYENRHQASFKGCFSAFSNFAHTPLYRLFVLGGRETIAHAKTCLGLLVCVADSHLQLLSAIRYTDSYRNYSINKMDFTSMSAYGSLAGHRNFFFALGRQFVISLVQVVFSSGRKGFSLFWRGRSCLTSQTSKPV